MEVLLLENDERYLMKIQSIIKKIHEGVTVYVSRDISNAYAICGQKDINVIIVDAIINNGSGADITGLEFVENIRQVKKYEFIPIIIITQLEDPRFLSFKEYHCFGYIEKPFDEGQVYSLIEKALKFPAIIDTDKKLLFRLDGIMYVLRCKDIICAMKKGRHLKIVCKEEEYVIPYWSVEKFLSKTKGSMILRINRYTAINMDYIKTIDYTNKYVELKKVKGPIEMSLTAKKRLLENLSKN